MDCNEARAHLIELADGALSKAEAAACRAHVEECRACERELLAHRRAWRLLGAIDAGEAAVSRARLESMAAAALAAARGAGSLSFGAGTAPGLRIVRRLTSLAAAAAVVLAVTIGARLVLSGRAPDVPPPILPACFDDPEFVKNFEVIRDLPDLDADGGLLDVDDDVLVLQALEGA
jgi:anti-sigma factor RsiW